MLVKGKVKLCFCYAEKDGPLCRELETHLAQFRNSGLVESWHVGHLNAGDDRQAEINRHIDEADLILLLISADFLAAEQTYQLEMRRALDRHSLGKARVIPILLRPVEYQDAPFARLYVLPSNSKPVTKWDNRDAAWADVSRHIGQLINYKKGNAIRPLDIVKKNKKPIAFVLMASIVMVGIIFISNDTEPARVQIYEKITLYVVISLMLILVVTGGTLWIYENFQRFFSFLRGTPMRSSYEEQMRSHKELFELFHRKLDPQIESYPKNDEEWKKQIGLLNASPPQASVEWYLVLTGSFDEFGKQRAEAVVNHLRSISNDVNISLVKIARGSIVLVLRSDKRAYEAIHSLFETGRLRKILDMPVESVRFLRLNHPSNSDPKFLK